MATPAQIAAIAKHLLRAYDDRAVIELITAANPDFDLSAAYEVLAVIEAAREQQGWVPVGRKIGFTNHTIWERYGVAAPMWARMWDCTVTHAPDGEAQVSLAPFVQPRVEPEVVLGLAASPPHSEDAGELLGAVEWIAAGFEIVQCPFPDWRFTAADCTGAFGLHGALVVGPPLAVTDANRTVLAEKLATFEAALLCDGAVVERGRGAFVLGSPARALGHLVGLVGGQPQFNALGAGEIITTGTLTDAAPIRAGQRWESEYGSLGVDGLRVTFT